MRPACSTGRWPSRCRSPSSSPALVGLAIERGIIRFLYGRPLETLLATWGVSLILQQAVRTIFGPTNREVGNPSWMSGVVRPRPAGDHLEPALDRRLRARRLRRPAVRDQAHAARACRCAPSPQNRRMAVVHGHPHALGRRADLRARLGHCRHRRRGAQPDRQRLAQSRPGLHHRQLHGRGVRRRRQSLGHAGRRAVARHRSTSSSSPMPARCSARSSCSSSSSCSSRSARAACSRSRAGRWKHDDAAASSPPAATAASSS